MVALAYPKPSKADRPKRKIDTTSLALPKIHPLRDDEYRKFVRESGPCWLLNFDVPCGTIPGRARLECAHLPHSGQRGTSEKVSDAACACLCPVHHDLLDGYTLPWQVIAFLWMKALFLREKWWRMKTKEAA